jgi:hypothetical protein
MLSPVVMALLATILVHDPDTGAPNWITQGGYTSPQTGVHCCGPNDCERVDPKTIEATPNGLILHSFGDEMVPWKEATPSEDGLYWRCHAYPNLRRCFFAPTGSQ